MDEDGSHLITLRRRGSVLVLRVDLARWGQTREDLRRLAVSAPHALTRERALALFDITQGRCATRLAARTGRCRIAKPDSSLRSQAERLCLLQRLDGCPLKKALPLFAWIMPRGEHAGGAG